MEIEWVDMVIILQSGRLHIRSAVRTAPDGVTITLCLCYSSIYDL